MIEAKDLADIGFLYKPHGFKGEINAELDYDEIIDSYKQIPFIINIDGIFVPFFCENIRKKGKNAFLVKFEDIDSDVQTAPITNHEVYTMKSNIVALTGISLEELNDTVTIEGSMIVDNVTNQLLGFVSDVEEGKEYDYLVVRREDEDEEFRIPLTEPFVIEIDEDEEGRGIIKVELPEGLIDL